MIDQAHEWTDSELEALEKKYSKVYKRAAREMRAKVKQHMADYDKGNADWKARVRSGEATQEEYGKWKRAQAARSDFLVNLSNTLATDAAHTNRMAADLANDTIPKIYAENANYAAYDLERKFGAGVHMFTLYDENTIRNLMRMERKDQIIKEVMNEGNPKPPMQSLRVNPDTAKDVRWNRQKFNAEITQGILQGESIPNISKRLQNVLNMDKNMATRAARTAVTSAENAGRLDSLTRAKERGIEVKKQWLATLDGRTRYSHRELDKQVQEVENPFVVRSNGHVLMRPADPTAHPSEVWNCRCTLQSYKEGIEDEDPERWSRLPEGMTYDQWKNARKNGVTEELLQETLASLNEKVVEASRKPTETFDSDSSVDYLKDELDRYGQMLKDNEWAKDFDLEELERENMRLYNQYAEFEEERRKARHEVWERGFKASSKEYKEVARRYVRMNDEWLNRLDESDAKLDAKRAYDRTKERYDDTKGRYDRAVARLNTRNEEAKRNREALEALIDERNGVIGQLSEKQGFAKGLREELGDDFVNTMQDKLDAARSKHPEIVRMYERFSSQFSVKEKEYARTAHYDPSIGKVRFNMNEDIAGSSYERPYAVVFHELGHLMDNASRYSDIDRYSYRYTTEANEITKLMKSDWTRFRNAEGRRLGVRRNKNEAVINMLKEEKRARGTYAYADVSDMIEGCARVSYPLGIGHGASYHERQGATGKEFMAEVCSAAICCEESYEQIVRIFPKSVEKMLEIARRISGDG